jgi:hypothetical protein
MSRRDRNDQILASVTAVDPGDVSDPTVSQSIAHSGPGGPDGTLTYSVGLDGGHIGPWIDADQQQRLHGAFAVGRVVQDRYRIDSVLGRGGMGVVFLGRDLRLDRPVAIKASLLLGRTHD